MANWCTNSVLFKGDAQQMKPLEDLFRSMANKEVKTKHGQLPDFIVAESGYFFEISWDEGVVTYLTKWSPNIAVVQVIGMSFKVDFTHSYEERAMGIYGEASYCSGVFQIVDLESSDLGLYDYCETSETYSFEGAEYQYEEEIMDILLLRKKLAQNLINQ